MELFKPRLFLIFISIKGKGKVNPLFLIHFTDCIHTFCYIIIYIIIFLLYIIYLWISFSVLCLWGHDPSHPKTLRPQSPKNLTTPVTQKPYHPSHPKTLPPQSPKPTPLICFSTHLHLLLLLLFLLALRLLLIFFSSSFKRLSSSFLRFSSSLALAERRNGLSREARRCQS